MAEIYNWQASRNNIINNAPFRPNTPEWQRVIQDTLNHPMASRVRQGVVTASVSWWENVDPRTIGQKDLAWKIGMGVGVAESIAVVLAPPGSGMIRGLINMVAMQGWNLIADFFPPSWDPRIKSFFKGLSAGALYASLPTALAKELFMGGVAGLFENHQIPVNPPVEGVAKATVVATPDHAATPLPTVKPSVPEVPKSAPFVPKVETPASSSVPTAPGIDNSLINSKVASIESNIGFKEALAAGVGEKLVVEDTVIADVLKSQGKSISDLTPQGLETLRKAIQQQMEHQANLSADAALKAMIQANPNLDVNNPATIESAKRGTKMLFDQWFDQPDSQNVLSEVAKKSLAGQQLIPSVPVEDLSAKLAKFVAESHNDHSLITEHIVERGETAGHLVMSMDAPLTWDGTDWQGFALLYALNPEAFADLRSLMGLSPQEFSVLLQKIQAGDMESYRKLVQYMGKVNAGQKVTLLTPAGLRKLLAS